jgi:hypothetical protein
MIVSIGIKHPNNLLAAEAVPASLAVNFLIAFRVRNPLIGAKDVGYSFTIITNISYIPI